MEQEQVGPKIGRGGLFRRFILPQIIIITVAGSLGIFWSGSIQRERDKQHLIDVVKSNASLTKSLNLPSSPQLASHLSTITGLKIGFTTDEKAILSVEPWSKLELATARLAIEHPQQVMQQQGLEAVATAVSPNSSYLIAIQTRKPLLTLSGGNNLLPLFSGILLAIASAFIIARSVVRPLQKLASHTFSSPSGKEMQLPTHLSERRDEIGILARTLIRERNVLLEEQELRRNSEKMALLGHLATSLAHEIKNPAAAIIMHARTFEHNLKAEGSLIQEEGEHIVSLVNQWLFVAKPKPPKTSEIDLIKLLRSLKKKLQALLVFHRCTIDLHSPPSLLVFCDTQRIEQVFRNLIDNAIHAMPDGGKITIQIQEKKNGTVEFKFADEGTGFSDTALQHFGETFYSEREGGMGLGLALTKGVLEAHGGTFSARNQTRGGALITGCLQSTSPSHSNPS